jgi:hypothetical protein
MARFNAVMSAPRVTVRALMRRGRSQLGNVRERMPGGALEAQIQFAGLSPLNDAASAQFSLLAEPIGNLLNFDSHATPTSTLSI